MATFIKSEFDAQWRVEDVEPKDEVRAAALVGIDDKPMPSGPPIVALIDLAYQTAQRIGVLLALN